ncbi:MAG: hypothetical protein AAF211_00340, partial [Myxococcota bacterium]
VRPTAGPDDASAFRSPAGFDRPVVVLYDLPGATGPVFLDPSCEACGPFELPTELWDAPVLAPGLDRTPSAPRGDIEVGFDDEGRLTYRFEGPTALEVRRRARTPGDVAAFVGDPRGTVDGFLDLAGPLMVTIDPAASRYDPLRLAPGVESGPPVRVVPGTRTVTSAAHGMPDLDIDIGPLRFRRQSKGDLTREMLLIRSSWVDPADAAALDRARFAMDPTSTSDSNPNPTPE